ncbi:DUF669 domain-containing protein [Tundrisphaera sp. TA3]|uniref:DUF669 domain-containing protein n=1 Tax=Tundrisphaera sp. TA3 TaxID=3435775 RepID=UPI003EB8A682
MAFIGQAIDTNTVEYNTGGNRDPLPNGVYSAVIIRAQQKETNKKDGIYVEAEFDITAPQEHAGRKFWDTFNLMNPSAEAQRIGLEQLGKLGKAAGIPVLEDDQQLVGKEVQIDMYVGKEKNSDRMRNRVSGYYPAGVDVKAFKAQLKPGASAPAAATGNAPAGQSAAPQAGGPSWRKPAA